MRHWKDVGLYYMIRILLIEDNPQDTPENQREVLTSSEDNVFLRPLNSRLPPLDLGGRSRHPRKRKSGRGPAGSGAAGYPRFRRH